MVVQVREGDTADAIALIEELRDPATAADFFASLRVPSLTCGPEFWTRQPDSFYSLRTSKGDLVGMFILQANSLAYLICASERLKGLGHALVAAALQTAAAQGISALYAHVARENVGSVRLLERAGFRFVALDPATATRPATLRFELEIAPVQP